MGIQISLKELLKNNASHQPSHNCDSLVFLHRYCIYYVINYQTTLIYLIIPPFVPFLGYFLPQTSLATLPPFPAWSH